jgi:hypothetical protein
MAEAFAAVVDVGKAIAAALSGRYAAHVRDLSSSGECPAGFARQTRPGIFFAGSRHRNPRPGSKLEQSVVVQLPFVVNRAIGLRPAADRSAKQMTPCRAYSIRREIRSPTVRRASSRDSGTSRPRARSSRAPDGGVGSAACRRTRRSRAWPRQCRARISPRSNALQIADIERILGAAVTWMLAFELAVCLLLGLGLFQRDDLRLGQHQAFLGALGFQRLEPFLHRLQVVAQPHTAHAGGGDSGTLGKRSAVSNARRCPATGSCNG